VLRQAHDLHVIYEAKIRPVTSRSWRKRPTAGESGREVGAAASAQTGSACVPDQMEARTCANCCMKIRVDLTAIEGSGVDRLGVADRSGANLDRFATEGHFTSWLDCARTTASAGARCSAAEPGG